jgi:hypothetical protein
MEGTPSNNPLLNPFWPDIQRAKAFLAQALTRQTTPDVAALGQVAGATNDIDANLEVPAASNYSGYIKSVTSSRFGEPTIAGPTRRRQLGFRLDF